MDTKEAIRLVEDNLRCYKEERDPIIDLLKQGEAYKQMWGELGIKLYRIDDVGFQEHYRISNVLIAMESLYNKYFPKPIKKTVADNVFSQVIELIRRCYMSGMQMDFLLEQVIELRKQHRGD